MRLKRKSRTFFLSFLATSVLFGILVVFGFFSPPHAGIPIQVAHLPSVVPQYEATWGRYVPSDVLQLSFQNYTQARSINSSAVPERNLVQFLGPEVSINSSEVDSITNVLFQTPNSSLDIIFLTRGAFETVSNSFGTKGEIPTQQGNHTVYFARWAMGKTFGIGWVTLFPRESILEFAQGSSSAKQAIIKSIDVADGSGASILSRLDVSQTLWIGNGTRHIAIGIQNFPGVVRTGLMTVIFIDRKGEGLQASYVVKFSDPQIAATHASDVASSYLSAKQLILYDSFVVAVESEPLANLQASIRLVG